MICFLGFDSLLECRYMLLICMRDAFLLFEVGYIEKNAYVCEIFNQKL